MSREIEQCPCGRAREGCEYHDRRIGDAIDAVRQATDSLISGPEFETVGLSFGTRAWAFWALPKCQIELDYCRCIDGDWTALFLLNGHRTGFLKPQAVLWE